MEKIGRHCAPAITRQRVYQILRRAGVENRGRVRWDRARLIERLQKLAAELGHTPGVKELKLATPPDHMTYVRNFGTIRAAQEAAGLVPNKVGGAGHLKARGP